MDEIIKSVCSYLRLVSTSQKKTRKYDIWNLKKVILVKVRQHIDFNYIIKI